MSDRYKGGILSGTAPTVTQQSANGVYTLSQELQYQGQGVWPTAAQNPITQSLRLRNSASAYLNRTPASAGNRQTWTYSAWIKRGLIGTEGSLISGGATTGRLAVFFDSSNRLVSDVGGTGTYDQSTAVYRDPSAWYHFVWQFDTTQATAANRSRMYMNGVQVSLTQTRSFSQNTNYEINNSTLQTIGTLSNSLGGYCFDGEITEVNFIDGVSLTPSSFGATDVNGIWQPIPYTGSYGTNGYYLPFSNVALTSGSNAGLGKDFSGNGNYWNTNNISVTTGSTYDAMKDSPSNASSTISNYCVLSAIDCYDNPPTQGNLARIGVGHTGSPFSTCRGTIGVSSGKWYFEALNTGTTGSSGNNMIGVMTTTASYLNDAYGGATTSSYQDNGGLQGNNSTGTVVSSGNGDIIMVAFDVDSSKMWVGKNGTWMNSGNPATGVGYVFSALPISPLAPQVSMYGNSGDTKGWILNFGQQGFTYTPPTGFIALNTYNLPVPTIPAGNKVMDATLYTGNGTSQSITNAAGFQTDLVWTKSRSNSNNHGLIDSVRGVSRWIGSNSTSAEDYTAGSYVTAFNSNGFSVGTGGVSNENGVTYVGWQWQAGQGVTSSNTNGSITSTVSVNPVAGFSVVTYTSTTGTVGHGLGVAPTVIIMKGRNVTDQWTVGANSLGWNCGLPLNTTATLQTNSGFWNNTAPTSTVFSQGSWDSGYTKVAYCFTPIAGYSAFGSYTGNGSSDGPFVYTGFRPKYVMTKRTDSTSNWYIQDTSRSTYNLQKATLFAETSAAEAADGGLDFLSNGFKLRNTDSSENASGGTYIYIAFAENPFKIARAR